MNPNYFIDCVTIHPAPLAHQSFQLSNEISPHLYDLKFGTDNQGSQTMCCNNFGAKSKFARTQTMGFCQIFILCKNI